MKSLKLRNVLYANTLFSTLSGLAMLLFSGWISGQVIDIPQYILMGMGVGLLLFAADTFYIAGKLPGSLVQAKLIFLADLGWVLATPVAMVMLSERLTSLGNFLLVDIALIVAGFAFFEWLAMKNADDPIAGLASS